MAINTELVGILNLTPDSFSDGGKYNQAQQAEARVNELFMRGANIVDIGAESTRPGATPLSAEEEWARLEPVLPSLYVYRGQISIDTYHPETVRQAARTMGDFIVNDVTGFNNPEMVEAVAYLGLSCIVSHLPRSFGQNIQAAHEAKPVNSIEQVRDELLQKRQELLEKGIGLSRIILDPGIGFGKTPELNWQLLRFADLVKDSAVMVGYSRKRFLGENRMERGPNLDAAKIAIEAGAKYLRVHDVAAHRRFLHSLENS